MRAGVLRDLPQVVQAAIRHGAGLGREQFAEHRPYSLDPAQGHGLAAHERPDQHLRISQPPPLTYQPSDGLVGFGEPDGEGRVSHDPRRRLVRHTRRVTARHLA